MSRRWLDDEQDHAPGGLQKVGYDSDRNVWTYRDPSDGSTWETGPDRSLSKVSGGEFSSNLMNYDMKLSSPPPPIEPPSAPSLRPCVTSPDSIISPISPTLAAGGVGGGLNISLGSAIAGRSSAAGPATPGHMRNDSGASGLSPSYDEYPASVNTSGGGVGGKDESNYVFKGSDEEGGGEVISKKLSKGKGTSSGTRGGGNRASRIWSKMTDKVPFKKTLSIISPTHPAPQIVTSPSGAGYRRGSTMTTSSTSSTGTRVAPVTTSKQNPLSPSPFSPTAGLSSHSPQTTSTPSPTPFSPFSPFSPHHSHSHSHSYSPTTPAPPTSPSPAEIPGQKSDKSKKHAHRKSFLHRALRKSVVTPVAKEQAKASTKDDMTGAVDYKNYMAFTRGPSSQPGSPTVAVATGARASGSGNEGGWGGWPASPTSAGPGGGLPFSDRSDGGGKAGQSMEVRSMPKGDGYGSGIDLHASPPYYHIPTTSPSYHCSPFADGDDELDVGPASPTLGVQQAQRLQWTDREVVKDVGSKKKGKMVAAIAPPPLLPREISSAGGIGDGGFGFGEGYEFSPSAGRSPQNHIQDDYFDEDVDDRFFGNDNRRPEKEPQQANLVDLDDEYNASDNNNGANNNKKLTLLTPTPESGTLVPTALAPKGVMPMSPASPASPRTRGARNVSVSTVETVASGTSAASGPGSGYPGWVGLGDGFNPNPIFASGPTTPLGHGLSLGLSLGGSARGGPPRTTSVVSTTTKSGHEVRISVVENPFEDGSGSDDEGMVGAARGVGGQGARVEGGSLI